VDLLLGFGQGGERVDAQQERPRLVVGHVQDLHVDFHVGVEIAAQVAVDQLQAAVGQLVGQQAAGEADFAVQRFESGLLVIGMDTVIPFVWG
jgi:hypothetical protein